MSIVPTVRKLKGLKTHLHVGKMVMVTPDCKEKCSLDVNDN